MTTTSTSRTPTAKASQYLQQLCKHWSHSLPISFTALEGKVTFPKDARGANWPGDAILVLRADVHTLECHIEASVKEQLDALKTTVATHLDRFAFREAPLLFDWQDEECPA